MQEIPRPEHPRPQFVREKWQNLNGIWEFEMDAGDSGFHRGLVKRPLKDRITVPFCPESALSGIGNTDFMSAVWYRRVVTLPENWTGQHVLLHFQAVDYDTTVWANGVEVTRHRGGFTPFTVDISSAAQAGREIIIVVRARDDNRPAQPRGKQSTAYDNAGCHYTRTTGIWQTVWLECVPEIALKRPRLTPDVANSMIRLEQPLTGNRPGMQLRATLKDANGVVSVSHCAADIDLAPRLDLPIPKARQRLWSPDDPHLYDITLELIDDQGKVVDTARSYAGLRGIAIDGKAVKINGKSVFQRLVLDQGYYPDGIMTAPTDEALIQDIKISMDAGYNGARLHQKVFEERFLYHADRMGYLIWGEFPDWGCGGQGPTTDQVRPGITYATQWLETLHRDYSHPSIIGWCPLNETAQTLHDRIAELDDATHALFLAAKAMDTTRPVLDTSGYSHRVAESDIYDSHDYVEAKDFWEGLELFKQRHGALAKNQAFANPHPPQDIVTTTTPKKKIVWSIAYRGQPYFISEFGGIGYNPKANLDSGAMREANVPWGYGDIPTTEEEFLRRFAALCDTLLDNPDMFGYCYTQLTDVFQEHNGLYYFDRTPKVDMHRVRAIQARPAAIEQPNRPSAPKARAL